MIFKLESLIFIKDGGVLTAEETIMINSIIDLREINVTKVMIPFEKIFMLNSNEKINEFLLKRIKIKGYSKIPVFEQSKNNVIGKNEKIYKFLFEI